MSAVIFTYIRVTRLRHKHIGRLAHIDTSDTLEDLGLESVTGTIASLSMWDGGVTVGLDFHPPLENVTSSLDFEFDTDDVIAIGGAS